MRIYIIIFSNTKTGKRKKMQFAHALVKYGFLFTTHTYMPAHTRNNFIFKVKYIKINKLKMSQIKSKIS